MAGATNQHYVPQSYLRRFAIDAKVEQVFVLDKASGRLFRTSVRNVAAERFFYDEGETQGPEAALAELESNAGPVLDRVAELDRIPDLTSRQIEQIAWFVAALDLRTSAFRNAYVDMQKKLDVILAEMARHHGGKYVPITPATDEEARERHVGFMWSAMLETVTSISRLKGMFAVAPDESRFVTSDHPVVKFNPKPPIGPLFGNLGWSSPGVHVAIPLTPDICLCLIDLEEPPPSVARFSADFVRQINRLQAEYSPRFLFASRADELLELERLMVEDPEVRASQLAFTSTLPF